MEENFDENIEGNAAVETDGDISSEDGKFLSGYKSRLTGPYPLDVEEISSLLGESAYKEGTSARERLTKLLLPVVPEVALEFVGEGLPLEDLVQEGNLGLMLALGELYASPYVDPEEILPYIRGEIRKAVESALSLNREEEETGELIAGRLNRLSDQIRELTEELGDTPSIEELSVFLEMPVEEIESLIRLTGGGTDDGGSAAEE